MIESTHPVLQGFLGTLFTWGMTALGSGMVFCVPAKLSSSSERKLLDCALGFGAGKYKAQTVHKNLMKGAGVMLAASYWSLLAPAISLADELGYGDLAFLPAATGVFLGTLFVALCEKCIPHRHIHMSGVYSESEEDRHLAMSNSDNHADDGELQLQVSEQNVGMTPETIETEHDVPADLPDDACLASTDLNQNTTEHSGNKLPLDTGSFRRTMLLVAAVTLHNFPEGLAVGVAFGSIGSTEGATFGSAMALAIGIGIQNFPEGIAVSLPLHRLGASKRKSFLIGQFSGMVEPLGGVLGAAAVVVARPLLPYALAFAAGAMIYVVIYAIVPETASGENLKASAMSAILGFIVMMTLDVALG